MSAQPALSALQEVEAKFRVHPPFQLPELVGERTGAASVDAPQEQQLRAVYWDTSDLRLAREGVTLRHRSGEGAGADGWHLKLPIREGRVPDASIGKRDEIHAVGDQDVIPAGLRDLLTPWTRTSVLGQVATLATARTSYLLRDADGEPVVELTDDLVSVLSSGHVAGRFREIEVEDRGGGLAAIEAVGDVLRTGGAVGGEFVPKVVRALGPQATSEPDPPLPGHVSPEDPARDAVRDLLRRNVRGLITRDVAVRREQPDSIHQMRVVARRLRSALKAFRPILDEEWANGLRAELKWLADALAGARDSEVLLERLLDDLQALPHDLVISGTQTRIEQLIGERMVAGGAEALEALRSERYVVLLERLVDAAWEPMTSPAGENPVHDAVPRLVATEWQRLAKHVKRLSRPEATDHDWHHTRIAAKQLRYTCESVAPILGRPARRLGQQAEAIQTVLGHHQDAAVAAEALITMAAAPGAGPESFTLGVLHSRQIEAQAAARAEFRRAWTEASRRKYRRWLDT